MKIWIRAEDLLNIQQLGEATAYMMVAEVAPFDGWVQMVEGAELQEAINETLANICVAEAKVQELDDRLSAVQPHVNFAAGYLEANIGYSRPDTVAIACTGLKEFAEWLDTELVPDEVPAAQ